MSLSLRGLLIALPVVALFVGGMAFNSYQSAIAYYRADAAEELAVSNQATAEAVRREIALALGVERKAAELMARKLDTPSQTSFDTVFARAEDGAFHTRPALWDGRELAGSIRVEGMGGFLAPPRPDGERRTTVLAAFDTLRDMANGLPREIESLYFFSPSNDLVIYAPQRPDSLSFYRTAPADFDFQDSEFAEITSPSSNPDGELRCTSLQQPAYDSSGENWTTGCMLPVWHEGQHLGAWGVSIPLAQLTDRLRAPPSGASTVIASADGRLIYHSGLAGLDPDSLASNVDLSTSQEPLLRGVHAFVVDQPEDQVTYSDTLQAYIATERLGAPDWIVLTVLPEEALSEPAYAIASRAIGVAVVSALLLGLLLAAIFHRTVAQRITRLASRTNTIAPAEGAVPTESSSDEIHQLEIAFERMEQRLQLARSREERSFDVLVDAARGYAMALFEPDGHLIRANKAATSLLGRDGLKEIGQEIVIAPGGARDAGMPTLPGPEPRTTERLLPDGRKIWIEEMAVPLHDDPGDIFATAYIGHDLTEYRDAQREIEKNLLYLELAQSSAHAGHFALDPETMELSLSSWLKDRLGVEAPTIPISDVAQLVDAEEREATMTKIMKAIAEKNEFAFETVGIASDGSRFPAMIRGSAVFGDDGKEGALVGYYGIVQDISEQKAAAEALLRARDAAEAEAQARADILAVISHEIRTPISGILGLVDQVRRERSERERNRALALIADSSDALLKTLDATLQRTRSEIEPTSSQTEAFSPKALIERVAELFRPLARRKGLALDVIAKSEDRVLGQPARIQQVLANFASNAIKFTPTGKVTLAVEEPDEGSTQWTFVVEDSGGGIDPERMKTIFEPFSGTTPDTLGRTAGSGLGLSITKDLAQQMGGRVTAENMAAGGARLQLVLPLEPVTGDEHGRSTRGTITIEIGQASLALRVEMLAQEYGFRAVAEGKRGAGADTPSVLVTDESNGSPDKRSFTRIIRLSGAGDVLSDSAEVAVSETELLDALPGLLDEIADG
ncbi:ATP-binding protein [Qipengyuania flava]|uniref:ATP-binding protein n=1 Tax=Qipengyuania flava TaxID=192812 RepID=UPI001C631468|nr:ATP-binding protein [Qipengyuania flava]QYJ06861.1 PAS domain S-box protein [Qipengyuania flava]